MNTETVRAAAKSAANSAKAKFNGAAPAPAPDLAAQFEALRDEVAGLKATVVPEQHTPIAEQAQAAYADMVAAIDRWSESIGAPSSSRALLSWAVGTLVAFGCGWAVGMVMTAVLVTTVVAGSAVLTAATWFVGLVISIIAGVKLGNMAADYISEKTIDRHYLGAKNFVTGLFSKKGEELRAKRQAINAGRVAA